MKKLIALLLCLAMLLSLCSVAMAAPKTVSLTDVAHFTTVAIAMTKLVKNCLLPAVDRYMNGINYVALGDSTTVGLFLGDYNYSYRHNTGVSGTDYPSGEYSEYTLFMNYLKEKYPDTEVNGTDLTLPGMRPIQLRGILGGAEEDAMLRARTGSLEDTTYKQHLDVYTNQNPDYALKAANPYESYQEMSDTYIAKLKEADVISYDMLMIDSLPTLIAGLANVASVPVSLDMFPTLMEAEGYNLISIGANTLRVTLNNMLSRSDLPVATINNLIDYLLFTYAGIVINVSKNLDWIYRNNRSAEVIVVGPINYISNISVVLGNATINIGRLWDCMADALTAYLAKGDPHANWYHLTDSSGANEICMSAYAQGKLLTDPEYTMIWDMMKEKYLSSDIDLIGHDDEVKANIAAACNFLMTNPIADPIPFMQSFQGGGAGMENALYAGIDATIDGVNYSGVVAQDSDMIALATALMFDDHRTGMHPSVEGCKDKVASIVAAYESCRPARDFYQTQRINFVRNSVGAVLGNQKSQAAVSNTLTKLFTPIVDLSGLLKKAG